jgi:hypothetical protein
MTQKTMIDIRSGYFSLSVMLEETPKGIDFTRRKSRLEYADVCFSNEPTLQQFTVKVISFTYRVIR